MERKLATKRLVVFDLETTGTDPARDLVVQVGAVVLDESLEEKDSFEVKVRIDEAGERAGAAALRLNSFDPGLWEKEAVSEASAAKRFAAFLKEHATLRREGKRGKPFFVAELAAYNAPFDLSFLKAWYERLNLFLPASYHALCIMQRAKWHFLEAPRSKPPSDWKLGTVSSHLGVPLGDEAHDALADARATARVYKALLSGSQASRLRYFQHRAVPWDLHVSRNGDRIPDPAYHPIPREAVVAVSRILHRAEELAPSGLTLEDLLAKARSFREAA